jgi:hypothetical protein
MHGALTLFGGSTSYLLARIWRIATIEELGEQAKTRRNRGVRRPAVGTSPATRRWELPGD